ncbi:hypothetical protein NKG94_00810 [Micromonospora sp. M12]
MGAYTCLENGRGQLARRMHEYGGTSSDPGVRRYGRQAWGLYHWDIGDIGEAYRCFAGEDGDPSVPDEETRCGGTAAFREGPGWRAVLTALHGDVESALAFVDTWDTRAIRTRLRSGSTTPP